MREAMKTLRPIRMPDHLDKQVLSFAREYFNGDYSKALRYLCQVGLIVSKRLKKEHIKNLL